MIESAQNSQVKYLKKLLQSASFRKKEAKFVIESVKVAETFFRAFPGLVKTVYHTEDTIISSIFDGSQLIQIKSSILADISTLDTSTGVCFLCEMPPEPVLNVSKSDARYLYLDGVRDPSNLGAILRSAVAFGLDAVLCSSDSVDLFHPKTIRSMVGTGFEIPVMFNAESVLNQDDWRAMQWVLFESEGGIPFKSCLFEGPTVLVLGSEGQGISSSFSTLPYRRSCTISIQPEVESLNVAVTAGIVCYEISRRN